MLALELVEIGEPLPHAEQPCDHELGDGDRGDADRIRDDDGVGQAGVVQVVDAGADRLDPAELRRELVDAFREVERHDDLRALPHGAALVRELVVPLLVADVLPELAHVGHRADLDAGHHGAELVEQVLARLPGVSDDHCPGESSVGHGRQDTDGPTAAPLGDSGGPAPYGRVRCLPCGHATRRSTAPDAGCVAAAELEERVDAEPGPGEVGKGLAQAARVHRRRLAPTCHRHRTGVEVRPHEAAVVDAQRERVRLREHERCIGLEHALDLAEHAGGVNDCVDRECAEHEIDRVGAQEGEVGEVAGVPVESDFGFFAAPPPQGEPRFGRVDCDDHRALLRERHRGVPVAAPEVEHALAGDVAHESQFVFAGPVGAVEKVGHVTPRRG